MEHTHIGIANRDLAGPLEVLSEESAVTPALGILRNHQMTGQRLIRDTDGGAADRRIIRNRRVVLRVRGRSAFAWALNPRSSEGGILDLFRRQHGYRRATAEWFVNEVKRGAWRAA
jgi:hypothetical protein